jgi:hypothetical protein
LFGLGLVRVVLRQPALPELRLVEIQHVVLLLLVRVACVLGKAFRILQVVAGIVSAYGLRAAVSSRRCRSG